MNKFFKSLAVFMLFSLVLFTVSCTATPEINTVNADAFAQKLNDNGNKAWSASAKYSYMHFHGQRRFDIQIPAKSWDGTLEFYNDRGGWEKITGKRTIPSKSYYFKLNGKSYSYAILIRGKDNTTITGGKAENGWKLSNNIQVIGGGLQALLTYGKASDVTAEQFAYIFGDVNGHKNITKADFATVGYTESVAKLADIENLDTELSASMPSSGTPRGPLTGTSPSSSPKSFPTSELDTSRAIDGKYGPNKVKDVVSLGYVVFESLMPFSVSITGNYLYNGPKNDYLNTDRVKPSPYKTEWLSPSLQFNTDGKWVDMLEYALANKAESLITIDAAWNGVKYEIKFRGTQVHTPGSWKVKGSDVEVSGDLRDLFDYKNHDYIVAYPSLSWWLDGQKAITKLPNDIIIPYTSKSGRGSYLNSAFTGTSINVAPNIKAEYTNGGALRYAFKNCKQLVSGGIVEIEKLDYGCAFGGFYDMYGGCDLLVNPGVYKIKKLNKEDKYSKLFNYTYVFNGRLRAFPYIEVDSINDIGCLYDDNSSYGSANSFIGVSTIKYSPVKTAECPNLYVKVKTPIVGNDMDYYIFNCTGQRKFNYWWNNYKNYDGATEIYTSYPVIR